MRFSLRKLLLDQAVLLLEKVLEIIDRLLLALRLPRHPSQKPQVLIVRLDAIGDFVLWLHSGKILTEYYKALGFSVHLMAIQACAELAKELSFWDRVIPVRKFQLKWNIFYRALIFLRIKGMYQIVIQPTYSREYFYGDSIVQASAAEKKIGAVGDLSNCSVSQKQKADRFYTQLIPLSADYSYEIERSADFVKRVTGKQTSPELIDLRLYLKRNQQSLQFIVSPGAQRAFRNWPVKRFLVIAKKIHAQWGLKCVVCGGTAEKKLCRQFVQAADFPVETAIGNSFLDYVRMIAQSKFVLSNESSAVHLAAACRVPAVAILGGGHFKRFLPYPDYFSKNDVQVQSVFKEMKCFGCNWMCEHPDFKKNPAPCIEDISTDLVWNAVERVLCAPKKQA